MRVIINPLRAIRAEAVLAAAMAEPWPMMAPEGSHLGGYGLGPLGDRATYYPNLWSGQSNY